MEKTVLQQKETYMDSVHRWGRIWGLSLMLLILAYPITVSLIFHAQVNWPAFVKGFIAIGPMYWAVGIVEIFTYVPMLGAGGSYLSFVTGNISNLKLPCALDAMERAGVKSNSEEGEIISTIAIAVSSIVTTLIIIVGVVLIVPLTPLLSSPVLAPAFSQLLPALFGGLAVVFISKNVRLSHCAGYPHAGAVYLCAGAQCVHGGHYGSSRRYFQPCCGANSVQKGSCLT